MSRASLLVSAAALTTLSLVPVGVADAAPSATAQVHSAKVCADASPGHAACLSRVRTDADAHPLATTGPTGFGPADLISAYALPSAPTSTQIIAIVDAYANPNTVPDLAAYRTAYQLPAANLTQMNQTGGSITSVTGDTGWGQEEMLDLEMASAICPSCSILYVGANSASFADLSAAVNTAAAHGANVISNSYGGSEFRSEASSEAAYHHPGVAITVSSGDSGYGTEFPASSQYVTAVGGTSLTRSSSGSRGWTESAWSGAGSGCSSYITKPTFQTDKGCSRRTVADVSAVADPATGVSVYDSYGSTGGNNWFVFGGTSVASPIVASVYALAGTTGAKTSGLEYNSVPYAHNGSLNDVTSGSNGRCVRGKNTSAAYLCTAGVGFDGPTGLGTPNGIGGF